MLSASVLITTYKRSHLLEWGLRSISKQDIPFDCEIIVLNDYRPDESEEICNKFRDKLNIRYVLSRRPSHEDRWRVPGFALNIGAKLSKGDVLFVSCAEIYHLNDTIKNMTMYMENHKKVLTVPLGKDDLNANFLSRLKETDGITDRSDFDRCGYLNVKIPFLMGIARQDYFNIGGYDEDFTGVGWEDTDFVERLLNYGCKHVQVNAEAVHLFHPRIHGDSKEAGLTVHNINIYRSKRGSIIRNENREWGVL